MSVSDYQINLKAFILLICYEGDGYYDSGIGMMYTSGELCHGGPERYTTVYVSCDPNIGVGYLYSATEIERCSYTL